MPNGRVSGPRLHSKKTSMHFSRLLTAVLCCGAVHAHEIGTTRVSVRFQQDRTYDVEIVTDATALAEKLEASVGSALPAGTDAKRLQALLPGFDDVFRRRIKLGFDGLDVHPQISYAVEPPIDA